MRKKYLQVLCAITSVILLGCSANSNNSENDSLKKSVSENTTEEVTADYPTYDSASDLVAAADLIIEGKVTTITKESIDISNNPVSELEDTGSQEPNVCTYNIYDVEISNVYKGEYTEDTIKIKQLDVQEAPDISKDNSYLFTLQTYSDCYPSLLNAGQSTFEVNKAESKNNVKKKSPNKSALSDGSEKKITLADVMDALN